jgi:LacI family transcriptional regulator
MPRDRANGGRRAVTLRDIAEAVGVDVSTVSKVINASDTITVRPETRQRILDEVKRTSYRPNAAARSLKFQRTGALGLVFPAMPNPLYLTITRGAMRQAAELGYVMLVAELSAEDPSVLERLVSERRVDGLIIATARAADDQNLADMYPWLPFVYVNRRVKGAHRSVIVDDESAGALAARALVDAGHRRLGFLGDTTELDTVRRRRMGFGAVCREAGVGEPVDVECAFTRAGGREGAERLAALPDRPTGVFAANLLIGIGAAVGLAARGLSIPRDLSLVTLDDEEAEYATPPLTAVRLPFEELGAASVREAHRILTGKRPRDVTVGAELELIERASLGPPPR